ncbi:hypothetical protein VTO73DRAFT_1568 [Trametes versicolor]
MTHVARSLQYADVRCAVRRPTRIFLLSLGPLLPLVSRSHSHFISLARSRFLHSVASGTLTDLLGNKSLPPRDRPHSSPVVLRIRTSLVSLAPPRLPCSCRLRYHRCMLSCLPPTPLVDVARWLMLPRTRTHARSLVLSIVWSPSV